jgi:hypothetical protein
LSCGNITVDRRDRLSQRLQRWAYGAADVVTKSQIQRCQVCGYEEIRRTTGQGARYIVMQEGILNAALAQVGEGMVVIGVNQATLRSFAGMKPKSEKNPRPPTWVQRAIDTFQNPGLIKREDQAVAAFVAFYICMHAEEVQL